MGTEIRCAEELSLRLCPPSLDALAQLRHKTPGFKGKMSRLGIFVHSEDDLINDFPLGTILIRLSSVPLSGGPSVTAREQCDATR